MKHNKSKKFWKRISSKKVRKCKYILKGKKYKKLFDLQWIFY